MSNSSSPDLISFELEWKKTNLNSRPLLMYLSRQIIHHAMINRIHEFLSLSLYHPLNITQWDSLLDNVPNYLVGCIIQKRSLFEQPLVKLFYIFCTIFPFLDLYLYIFLSTQNDVMILSCLFLY